MPLKVWNGSAWVTKPLKVWNGAAWVVKPLKRWTGSAWAVVAGQLGASASPTSLTQTRVGPGPVTSGFVLVTAQGGAPGYTYNWSIIGVGASVVGSPAANPTSFTGNVVLGQAINVTARCRVTDSLGAFVDVDVPVTLRETTAS